MGKVQYVKKSRKEWTCRKCRKSIKIGDSYYRGVINFQPDIIRCCNCGLQSWEVTSSEYQLAVGEVVYRWQETYSLDDDTADSLISALEDIKVDVEDRLDNMPDSLRESPTGELLQERIDMLDGAIDELGNIDTDYIKSEVLDEYFADEEDEEKTVRYLDGVERGYDEIIGDDTVGCSIVSDLIENYESKLSDLIEDALSCLF